MMNFRIKPVVLRYVAVSAVIWVAVSLLFSGPSTVSNALTDQDSPPDLSYERRQVAASHFDALLNADRWQDADRAVTQSNNRGLNLVAVSGSQGAGLTATILVEKTRLIRVQEGDDINGETVVSIDPGNVVISSDMGTTKTLVLYE